MAMASPQRLPEVLDVEITPEGGVRYLLPSRKLGAWRWVIGGILLVGSLSCLDLAGLMLMGYWPGIGWLGPGSTTLDRALALFPVFVLALGAISWIPFGCALLTGGSRCEIQLNREWLTLIEYIGTLSIQRQRSSVHLRRLCADRSVFVTYNNLIERWLLDQRRVVVAEFDDAPPIWLAAFYSRELAEALARDITERHANLFSMMLSSQRTAQPATRPTPVIFRINADDGAKDQDLDTAIAAVKPWDSSATIESNTAGVIITIRPSKARSRSGHRIGLFFFTCMLVCVTILVVATNPGLTSPSTGATSGANPWIPVLILCGMWCVAGLIAAKEIDHLFTHTVFEVNGQTLRMTQSRLLGAKHHEWPRGQNHTIQYVRLNYSRGRYVNALEITGISNPSRYLLKGRDEAELRWLAANLRLALRAAAISDVQ